MAKRKLLSSHLFVTTGIIALRIALFLAVLCIGDSAAQADSCDVGCILFTLDDVSLGGGAEASGTFVWSYGATTLFDVNVTTTSGPGLFGQFQPYDFVGEDYTVGSYSDEGSNSSLGASVSGFFLSNIAGASLSLLIPNPVSLIDPNTLFTGYYGSLEVACQQNCYRFVGSGSLDPSPFPVPAPIVGAGVPGAITGLALIGLLGWRGKRKAQAVA
jgi:hypothetical protein